MRDEYSIGAAFAAIEDELIASMMRNMARHRAEETAEGIQWAMWQAEQLKALEKYKRENRKRYKGQFQTMNQEIEALIRKAKETGGMDQEKQILQAIRRGFKGFGTNHSPAHQALSGEFFRLNERKLEALIKATTSDMERAETAVLRMADDEYRKAIFNAQVYANTGAGTYEKAVDMATKDLLSRGLNCVVYANGARHTLSDYADMAVRTASKRAYLQGEGEKRQEWGIATVIVNKRGNPCPKCLPFCGKVLIDDVWSGGSKDGVDPETGKRYPLVSKAIAHGLYHPRCKDSHTTYFPGISTADDTWTEEELEAIGQASREDERKQYAERQVKKYNRLAAYSMDEGNRKQYQIKVAEWKGRSGETKGGLNVKKSYENFLNWLRNDNEPSNHKYKLAMYAEFTELIEDPELNVPFAYRADLDVVKYNSSAPFIEEYDINYVYSHEISHRMDELEYHSWENENFLQAIESCARKVYAQKEEIQAWFEPGGKYEQSFAISDIINALSENEISVPIGHDSEYWKQDSRFKAMEIFADLSSIDVLDLNERETVLEELFKAYQEVIQ